MKALTIRQPWASLIVSGEKTVENRSWRTDYRGPLVIHAAAKVDDEAMRLHPIDNAPLGMILGTVEVIDCVQGAESEWAIPGQWHWLLANPRPCDPRPAKGKLGLWTPTSTDWAGVRRTRPLVERRQSRTW